MNTKTIFFMAFIIIFTLVYFYANVALTDEETKKKKWFKVYVIYMKIAIGIMIIIAVEGIMTNMRFW